MKISIVIPCYNEKSTIEKIVEAVAKLPSSVEGSFIVDDCSEDGTKAGFTSRPVKSRDRS